MLRFLNKFYFNLSWKNRRRIDNFFIFLRNHNLVFDGFCPCIVFGKHEYIEPEFDNDRYYEMLDLEVKNIFTGRKYILTQYK